MADGIGTPGTGTAAATVEREDDLTGRLRVALKQSEDAGLEGAELSAALAAAIDDAHPADVADAMADLPRDDALRVFAALDLVRAAETLDEVDPDLSRYLLDHEVPGRIAALLDLLPPDDAAEVVSEASPERQEELLEDLERRAPEDAAEVRELLSYREDTAGRLMTDKFARLDADLTVDEAFAAIRSVDPDVETLNDLYVVEPAVGHKPGEERLVGVLSLRDLVRARPEQRVRDIMVHGDEIISVSVDTDQEEVARVISKYDFLALPVLDRDGNLAGIVTVDDVVDVLVEEQTEDVLKLGAVQQRHSEIPYLSTSVLATVRQRFGWLLLLFVASFLTAQVGEHYEGLVGRVAALASFVPMLIGTGGNAGAQAVMTVTRALALGEVRFGDWVRVLWRELRTGLVLGGTLSAVGFVFVFLVMRQPAPFAAVIACSITGIVIWATIVGSILPIVAKRLGFDPAVMSAPFITTLVDATGLILYFNVARLILRL